MVKQIIKLCLINANFNNISWAPSVLLVQDTGLTQSKQPNMGTISFIGTDTGLTQSKQPNMGIISFIGTGHWTNTKQTT